jgi:hypothetical protein
MENRTYHDSSTGKACAERRSGSFRRTSYSFSFRSLFLKGPRRRKSRGRRITDKGAYVDIYDSRSWSIAIAVLILSLMDALLTSMHLVRGTASELNPILNEILDSGGLPAFFAAKAAMTVFPMAIILIHKEWTLGRYAARLCLFAYILLSCYHTFLIIKL